MFGIALLVAASWVPGQGDPETTVAVLPMQLDDKAREGVPDLIDDYLLTAVQNVGGYRVIGPDDVSALLSFEKQKDLLNCDEASCYAEISGGLGAEQLAVFKAALLENEWVITGKLIDLSKTRVLERTNDFVGGGDAKALLQALPRVAFKLLGRGKPMPPELQASRPPQPQERPARRERSAPDPLDFLTARDRLRYETYAKKTKDPKPVPLWAAEMNEESTGLLLAELGSLGVVFVAIIIDDDFSAVLGPTASLSLVTLLIIDAFDVGEVDYRAPTYRWSHADQPAPPVRVALPEQQAVGMAWGWSF